MQVLVEAKEVALLVLVSSLSSVVLALELWSKQVGQQVPPFSHPPVTFIGTD